MVINGKFARYANKMKNAPKFKGHKEKKVINTDGNLDALERHLDEREEDDERLDMQALIETYEIENDDLRSQLAKALEERDAYVEQLMTNTNTFSEMHLEIEQLKDKVFEMQARINRLTLGGNRR